MQEPVYILGIESSCDDTSAAVLRNRKVLSNVIACQDIHKQYGGVVPELASRAHQQNIIPVVDIALKNAGLKKEQLSAIAFTRGPGLIGSLLVGTSFAKAFALGLKLPIIEVHHMQAHIMAHFIEHAEQEVPDFPFLCLTVSGGHTQIVMVTEGFNMEIIGATLDDAAGEAFDKSAKLLGLPYPGGPLIDQYAKHGDQLKFSFSHPQVPELNYSFSGLKTSILYFLQKQLKNDKHFISRNLNDLCASIQYKIVVILLEKLFKAVEQTNIKQVAIAGGVSANSLLREELLKKNDVQGWKVFIPQFEYCTDNAAMIGISGYFKYLNNEFSEQSIAPSARLAF